MALEDKIQELIDSVNRNTAVTESLMNLRKDAIEAVKGEAAPATKKAGSKPQEKPAAKEDKPQISETPEDRQDTSAYDGLGEKIKEYVGFDDDTEKRKARQANVKKIFGHEKIQAKKHTEVPEAMIPVVIKNIDKLIEKAREEAAAAADSGDDDDLMG
jgi:hypothetical protein